MKFIFYPLFSLILGLASAKLYLSSKEKDAGIVLKLKDQSLKTAFMKINETSRKEFPESERDNSILQGINLKRKDLDLLSKYEAHPIKRNLIEAIVLADYSNSISESEYDDKIETFKSSLSVNSEDSFNSALELLEDESLIDAPLRKASLYLILTSVPGKEEVGMTLALREAQGNRDTEEGEPLKEESHDKMLLPVLALEAALKVMKNKNIYPTLEYSKAVEAQRNIHVRKAMYETFLETFPNLKNEIQLPGEQI